MTSYYETSMPFDLLRQGVVRYGVPTTDYFLVQLHNNIILVATKSDILCNRFDINPAFKKIELSRDDLYFRMGDEPVKLKAGNPNLMPFV